MEEMLAARCREREWGWHALSRISRCWPTQKLSKPRPFGLLMEASLRSVLDEFTGH